MTSPTDTATDTATDTVLSENPPTSRRAVLAGVLGGVGALAAAAIGRPRVTEAHDPQDIQLGTDNLATSRTRILNNTNDQDVFTAESHGSGSGVQGLSSSGDGVSGTSSTSAGVFGLSNKGNGVEGRATSPGSSGVYGFNQYTGYGVAGRSDAGPLVQGAGAAAVLGDNIADGIGVWARSANGIGLFADAVNSSAVALKAQGVAQFTRSGKLTILAGQASVTKNSIRIDAGSLVLAVLSQSRTGIWVRAAVPDAAGDAFTIYLNKPVASDTKVSWFIVN